MNNNKINLNLIKIGTKLLGHDKVFEVIGITKIITVSSYKRHLAHNKLEQDVIVTTSIKNNYELLGEDGYAILRDDDDFAFTAWQMKEESE